MDRIIKNEFIKLFKEKKFYITTLLIIVIGVVAVIIDKNSMRHNLNFKESLETFSTGMTIVLTYWIIILFSDIITEEYKSGTMKLSLVSTITRTEYLIGKLVFGFLTLLLMATISFLAGVITSGVLVKFGTAGQLVNMFTKYIIYTIPIFGFGTLVMIVAILLASSGYVIASGIGLTMLLQFLPLKFKWFGKYEITGIASQFIYGKVTARIFFVCLGYIFFGTLISILIFKKKEIRT